MEEEICDIKNATCKLNNFDKRLKEIYLISKKCNHYKGSDENFKKLCDSMKISAKEGKEDIEKAIREIEKYNRWFTNSHYDYDCSMVHYNLKEDCENHPENCPMGIKQQVIKEIEEELKSLKELKLYSKDYDTKYTDLDITKNEELLAKFKK